MSTSDFTIHVKGKAFHVHRVVLQTHEYFETMFKRSWKASIAMTTSSIGTF